MGLEATWRSVVAQQPRTFEWIVVDGLSTDGSGEFLLSHQETINHLILESDAGIADAFNKGLNLVTTGWVLFLNSGDCFRHSEVAQELANWTLRTADLHLGQVQFGEGLTSKVLVPRPRWMQVFRNYWPHQGMLISTRLFADVGGYSKNLALGMDYEWSARLIVGTKFTLERHSVIVSIMQRGGVSETHQSRSHWAYNQIRKSVFKVPSLFSWLITVAFLTKTMLGNLVRSR